MTWETGNTETSHFYDLGTWKYWNTNHFEHLATWTYWETSHFEGLGTWTYWNNQSLYFWEKVHICGPSVHIFLEESPDMELLVRT